MKIPSTILIAWWLYVQTLAPMPLPIPGQRPPIPRPSPVWTWEPRERFLHQEFCELNARRLRREGMEAICVYRDD